MSSKWDIGCYGDGACGHQHTREACADILMQSATSEETFKQLAGELLQPMSDDGSEETDACEYLNGYAAVDGASWGWQDGDFGLWPNEEE